MVWSTLWCSFEACHVQGTVEAAFSVRESSPTVPFEKLLGTAVQYFASLVVFVPSIYLSASVRFMSRQGRKMTPSV